MQTGFHGLAGLAVARFVAPRLPAEAALPMTFAATLGGMLPDVDLYPASIAWLAGRQDLAEAIHRSLTHSVLLEAAIAIVGLGLLPARPRAAWAFLGLSLGMLTHTFLDILMWFAAVDLFWPLSHLPIGAHAWHWPLGPVVDNRALLPALDIWNANPAPDEQGAHLPAFFGNPDFVGNALGAMEAGAFALFYTAIGRIAGPGAVKRRTPGLWRWTTAAWVVCALLLLTAAPVPYRWHVIAVQSAMLLCFLPYAWVTAVRHRDAVAFWSRTYLGEPRGHPARGGNISIGEP